MRFYVSLALVLSPLLAQAEIDVSRRVQAHFVLEDYEGAYLEAKEAFENDPLCKEKLYSYMKVLAALNRERDVLDLLTGNFEICKKNHELLEDVAWSVIRKGHESSQVEVRLVSLIGAHLTGDAKALPILLKGMGDPNAIIRSVSIQLAAHFGDLPLREQILKMFKKEKIWFVRLGMIQAAGMMKMKEASADLMEIATSHLSTYEEQALAMESLVKIFDRIDRKELEEFAHSPSSGIRAFSCDLIQHLQMKEGEPILLLLLKDPVADVRVKALETLALLFFSDEGKENYRSILEQALKDPHPEVAIIAGWAAMRVFPELAQDHWEEWIFQKDEGYARFAAAALASAGNEGVHATFTFMTKAKDPYVKMNLALGLLGQRSHLKEACDVLVEGMKLDQKWMLDQRTDLFSVLTPSHLRHENQIPFYPEGVDQMTRLQLLSMLANVEDSRAQEEIRAFLQKKKWGITGFAAATLLREGDESSLKAVKKLLKDPDGKVRIQAALVMAFFGKDPSVVSILEKAYFEADHEMKGYILEALGHISKVERSCFFMEVWQDPSQMLRVIGASSFLQCMMR